MQQDLFTYNQSFEAHFDYTYPSDYNYSYYSQYQPSTPDQFSFLNHNQSTNLSSDGIYTHSTTSSNDNQDYTSDYNFGSTFSFNESQNYSYNDSAYQTQLETSSFYSHYLNVYENTLKPVFTNDGSKRLRDEISDLFSENQLSSKRPKILKLYSKEEESFYYCEDCSLSFSSKAKFLLHQFKAHKNGSSCVCPVCYKKFGNQANTLVHLRGHTQEKTYKCNQCSHAFYDSSTLKKHMRTHTGEKPYNCHLCPKKFTQSGNLKRHLLVHKKYNEDVQIDLPHKQIDEQVKNDYDWSKYGKDQLNVQQPINYYDYYGYNTNNVFSF